MSALTVADNKGSKRPQYKDYVTFLGNYKNGKKDDQCSVSTNDSGVGFSLNNSSNNSSSSINSDLTDSSKNGFKDYLEHYNNKKYSPVQPAFIKKPDNKQQEEAKIVKTEVYIEINNPPNPATQVSKVISLNNGQNLHNQSSNVSKVSKIFETSNGSSETASSKAIHPPNKVNKFNFEQKGAEGQSTIKHEKKKRSIGEISKKFEANVPKNPPVAETQKVQLKKTISISEKSKIFEENTTAHNTQVEIKKQAFNEASKIFQHNEESITTAITNGSVSPKPPIHSAKPVIVPKSFTENNVSNPMLVQQKSPTPLEANSCNFAPPPPPPLQIFVNNIPQNSAPSPPRQSPTPPQNITTAPPPPPPPQPSFHSSCCIPPPPPPPPVNFSHKIWAITGEMHEQLLAPYLDFLAFTVCIVYALLLGVGVKASSIVNSFLTLINLAVMALVIVIGFYYADEANWTSQKDGFLPHGFAGVVAGAATCFYAFVGFDSIATSGEEAKNPSFSIPMATVISMGVVTLGYVLVSSALTLIVPYSEINPNAALPEAFSHIGMHWVKYVVSLGAICGMTTTLFGSLFSLPRCMYAMAVDGLLFRFLGNVNSKTQVPLTNLVISGLLSATIALLFNLETLVKFMSIGTLLAYTIVSASVIILRYRPSFETIVSKPVSTPSSEISSTASDLTTPASEIIDLTGTLRVQYSWLGPIFGNCEPGSVVTTSVFIYTIFASALCVLFQISAENLKNRIWWTVILAALFILVMGVCMLLIVAHHQNNTGLRFKVPLVPFIPALSILCNIEFMIHLNILAWLMFFVWMIIGMLVYFLYGIHHSKEGESKSSYSILMSSSEAVKEKWCTTTRTKLKGALTRRKSSSGDRSAIIDEEESTE